jgi:hypothetical protein
MAFTPENAVLEYESDQSLVAMVELTNDGDNKNFKSAHKLWSNFEQNKPDVKVNGVLSGGRIVPAVSGTDDLIDVTNCTVNLNGVLTTVSGDTDIDALRSTDGTDIYKKCALTITSAGAWDIVEGAAHTAFSDTWGADGGPPLIPVDSVLVGIISMSSDTAAAISVDEISQVPRTTMELAKDPYPETKLIRVENGIQGYAGVEFSSALPNIHTGGVPKKVFAKYYTPVFSEVPDGNNFTPPQNSVSVSSKTVYKRALGSRTKSIGTGSYVLHPNGLADNILMKDEAELWHRFYRDEYVTDEFILSLASVTFAKTFDAEALHEVTATMAAVEKAYVIQG